MKLLFHVFLNNKDPSPYAVVIDARHQTVEECYRIEQGVYLSALEAYDHIKDKISSIEKIYCDPNESADCAENFLKDIKNNPDKPQIFFSKMVVPHHSKKSRP